jgi:hypothetical protein
VTKPRRERGTEVVVDAIPTCDICIWRGVHPPRPAAYDGKTKATGTWAWQCEEHHKSDGMGVGLGRGQKLILRGTT